MALLVLSTLFIIWTKNPLFAILGLISVFINSSILLLSLNVNFLALIYVIIYVGAICVLFLFVVMLLNIRQFDVAEKRLKLLPFFLFYLTYLISYFLLMINKIGTHSISSNIYSTFSQSDEISMIVFHINENPLLFILITLLLFLAILAPIAIAAKRIFSERKQDLYFALSRDLRTVVFTKTN